MNLVENQKEYWNSVADEKKFTTPFHIDVFSKYVSKSSKILDVGCGYGRVLNELYNNSYNNLYGIDFSEKMIERGKVLFPYLNLCVQKSASLDFEDNSFDGVILFAVLTCIIKDSEQEALINEIRRVLKPDGVLYINDFLLNHDERNIQRYEKFKEKYGIYGVFELPEGALVRHHELNYIKGLTSNYEKLVLDELTFTTMNGNKSNGFMYIGKNIK